MSKSETRNVLSRRTFIGSSAALGAAGLAVTQTAKADKPPDKFNGKKPMKPAPSQVQAITTAPPLAALVLNKAAYGPRPGDIEAFNALGGTDAVRLSAWVPGRGISKRSTRWAAPMPYGFPPGSTSSLIPPRPTPRLTTVCRHYWTA